MITSKNKLKIPPEELRFTKPDIRSKLFKEIYSGYKNIYGLKLIYAYLNTDPSLLVDYCVIYKARNDDDTTDIIVYDIPPIHSHRSTPGYRYCRRTHQENKFFESGVEDMVVMDKNKFYEFIMYNLEYSLDKNDPKYWKNPENYKDLLQGLLDISLRYNKKISV